MAIYETPVYKVLKSDRNYEIRAYPLFHTVSVKESKLSGYQGFGVLFSYINGKNHVQESISMTVPVINTFEEEGMTMEFVVSSKVDQGNIPLPKNEQLNIKTYKAHIVASVGFKGLTTSKRVAKKMNLLTHWIEKNKYIKNGDFRLARYNRPFTLPWARRNEILVDIKDPFV